MTNNPSDLERLLADLDDNQRDGEAHFDFAIRLARARTRLAILAPDLARKVITLQARVEELEAMNRQLLEGRGPGNMADCPGDHGESCCGYPDKCRAALQPNTTEETGG